MPRLCIFGCRTNDVHTHRFPNPEKYLEQFQNWLSRAGGTSVPSSDYKLYKNKVICDRHFTDADRNRNNRLNRSAVPSLLLGIGLSDHGYTKDQVHNDHSYVKIGVSGIHGTNSSRIPRGTASHEVPVAHGVYNDTLREADEVALHNALKDPESGKSKKAVFSWDAKELIVAADETDVLQFHQKVSAVPDGDLTETSSYQDDDSLVPDDYSGYDHSYGCNECGERIVGFRYTCVQCADWDLCGACGARAAHAAHYLLRVPCARPYKEIQAVLATIRQHLLSENHFEPETAHSVKLEPEELLEPQEPEESEEPQETQETQESPPTAPPPEGDPLDWEVEFLDSCYIAGAPEGRGEGAPRAKRARPPPGPPPPLRRLPIHRGIPNIVHHTNKVPPIRSRSEDHLGPRRTERSPGTAPVPNIESARKILVRIPAGFDPVGIVKMLNPQVSVRLKPMEKSSTKVFS